MPGSRRWRTPDDPRVPPNSRPVREPLPQPRIQPQLAGPQTFRRSADSTPTSLPASWTPGGPPSVGHLIGSSTLPHSARSWSLRGPCSWVAPVPAAAQVKPLEGALDHVIAAQPPTASRAPASQPGCSTPVLLCPRPTLQPGRVWSRQPHASRSPFSRWRETGVWSIPPRPLPGLPPLGSSPADPRGSSGHHILFLPRRPALQVLGWPRASSSSSKCPPRILSARLVWSPATSGKLPGLGSVPPAPPVSIHARGQVLKAPRLSQQGWHTLAIQ